MAQMIAVNDVDMPKVILFYAPQMASLAHKIAQSVQACHITWRRAPAEGGFPKINIDDYYKVRGSIVVFLACFDDPECIYEQFAVMSKLPRFGASVFKILMPFFPSLTLQTEGGERGSGKMGEIPTARTLARLLSAMPKAKSGPTELVVYDIHHLQERFYFDDDTVPRLETSMPLILLRLDEIVDSNHRKQERVVESHGETKKNGETKSDWESATSSVHDDSSASYPWDPDTQEEYTRLKNAFMTRQVDKKRLSKICYARRKSDPNAPMIAFPDEKTAKRFGKHFQGFDQVTCTRMMKAAEKVVVLEGNPRGRQVVLIDDIIITGSTMIKCAELLRSLGAVSINVYVTHANFTENSWKSFTTGLFDKVWIVSLAPLLGPILDEEAFLAAAQEDRSKGFRQMRADSVRSRL
ncbi:hypothetical protein GUITHDRAFT_116860 [Guillardia theta CCMP2712]|uniref:Phosphoribosyltransferase domain-containing protein n=1 Tax=Guillardia theta (strain CCMP2712) TaxID=905079 RepID=L1IL78_GUITC|nr:hypothetical protein GUITHDRAFT_116860 [Guillardia theta CCMP2712]EKX36996.1 hypothetical protein GUITHDRAFT_116860 [Guillardia theta CCMP2712]|eukprot:XP_005823976.1 hypothetical protein GUITHDRAFT_116860 [Guillardia theta CCMP2712]